MELTKIETKLRPENHNFHYCVLFTNIENKYFQMAINL